MSKVVLDAALRSKLENLTQAVELCDEGGNVFGHFIPKRPMTQMEGTEPQISREELRRREQQGGGRTLTEILGTLEKRA
jgi:hypothetical protein